MSAKMSRQIIVLLTAALLLAGVASGLSGGKERPISTLGSLQEQPAIDGHIVAWADNRSGNFDIFMYDLETGTERGVSFYPGYQDHPAVSGNRIVWQDMRSGESDIYLYDYATREEMPITTAPGNQFL
ncbi:MAG: biopolymer transporter Tol, partial [Methanothrix sp.]|nr:biopolymer transporter Tol [Methanothrix sp.]